MKNKIILISIITLFVLGSLIFSYQNMHYKNIELINYNINDITFKDEKPNIYLFYRIGCPHCEKMVKYISTINNKYYDIYTFEVSKDKKNSELMDKVILELSDDGIKGVPYLIIGNKSFNGFTKSMEESIKKEIISNYENDEIYDIIKKITK